MSNLQPNCCLEFDFRKVDQHAGGKWLIHDTKRRKDNQLQSLKLPCRISKLSSKMWHKGVRWHRVESNILKEGPGTKTSWMEVRGYMDGWEAIFFGSGFRWARARMEVRCTFWNLCGSEMVSLWIWDAIVGAWLGVRCHLDGGDMQLWGPGLGWDSIWMKVSRESRGLDGVERGVDGSETQMPRYLDGV